jgi:hypothetical protein
LVPETIKNCKKVNDLDACSEDIRHILNFCIEILGVKPKDCKLLISEDLFVSVVKHVLLEGEEKIPGWQYFHEAKDDAQRK